MCAVDECEKRAVARGWCRSHYNRWRAHGDPTAGRRVFQRRGSDDRSCAAPGCEQERYRSGGYCNAHKYNLTKYGTIDRPERNLKPDGYEITDHHGYIRVMMRNHPMANGKGYIPKHRLVMSDHLGRNLDTAESVHHKNGDKTDNRLENLELWVGYGVQPSGQRPRDLVEWARAIVERYGDEVDAGLL